MRLSIVVLLVLASQSWAQIGVNKEAEELNRTAALLMPRAFSDPSEEEHVLALLDSAIQKDSLYHFAYLNKATLYRLLGRRSEALSVLQRLATVRPDYIDACTWQALILERCGRLEEAKKKYLEAIAKYDQLIAQDPSRVRPQIGRATVISYFKGHDEGLEEYERIAAANPDDKYVLMTKDAFRTFDKKNFLETFCK